MRRTPAFRRPCCRRAQAGRDRPGVEAVQDGRVYIERVNAWEARDKAPPIEKPADVWNPPAGGTKPMSPRSEQ